MSTNENSGSTKKVVFYNSVTNRVVFGVILGVIVLVVTALITMSIIVKNQLNGYFAEQMEQKQTVLNIRLEAQKNEMVNAAKISAQTLGGDTWTVFNSNRAAMQDMVENMAETYDYIDSMKVYGPKGQQVWAEYNVNGFTFEVTEAVIKACQQGQMRYNIRKSGSDTVKLCGYPIFDEAHNFVGFVLCVGLLSDQITMDQMKNNMSVEMTIFDNYTKRRSTISGQEGTQVVNRKFVDDAMQGKHTVEQIMLSGKPFYSLYFPLTNAEGEPVTTLQLALDASVRDSLASTLLSLIIPIVMLAGVIVLVVLYLVILRPILAKPLKSLDSTMVALVSEQADLTIKLPTNEKNEFDMICLYVNKFIERLHGIVTNLTSSQNSLLQLVEGLSSNSHESASSIAEIMANIGGVRKQSENQASSVTKTSSVLAESSTSCNALAQLISDEAAAITESSAAIEEMLGNIRSVSSNIEKMFDSFKTLNENVADGQKKLENVNKKTQQIEAQSAMLNDANAIISQIASQTNLLAMNAAIEAAHAGEAGKGFSVVADEIRKLAENSSAQSKQISNELKEITSSIKEVVEGSNASQQSFTHIVEHITFTNNMMEEIHHAMQEQEEASQQIFEALSDMRNQSSEVGDKSHDLETGVNKVSQEMDNVNQISDTILGSMDEMATGAEQINIAAQEIANMANQTKDATEEIDKLLKQFLL